MIESLSWCTNGRLLWIQYESYCGSIVSNGYGSHCIVKLIRKPLNNFLFNLLTKIIKSVLLNPLLHVYEFERICFVILEIWKLLPIEQKVIISKWPYRTFHGLERPIVILYGLLWSCMILYSLLWSCMAFYGLVWPFMFLCGFYGKISVWMGLNRLFSRS